MKDLFTITATFLIVALSVTTSFCQTPAGDRTLAYEISFAENQDFTEAFFTALSGCMQVAHLQLTWGDLETAPGQIDGPSLEWLEIANAFYPVYGLTLELNISPINTTFYSGPADLENTPFDDPVMIDRFKTLLDTVFAKIPDIDLRAFNIGNESDIYWGTDLSKYTEYKVFYDQAADYARQKYLEIHGQALKVGTTLSFQGVTEPFLAAAAQGLNENSDIISITYYPLDDDGLVRAPVAPVNDFAALVNLYPDPAQPIFLVECGYPSSTLLNSSEEKQRDFWINVFNTWDTYADHIKHLLVFQLTDWSQTVVDELAVYYGINSPEFKEFLRTLGVRTFPGNGSDKPAFPQIVCEANARGFCLAQCTITSTEPMPAPHYPGLTPNPTSGTLQFDEAWIGAKVNIYNASGRFLIGFQVRENNIDLNLPSGLYFLEPERNGVRGTAQKVVMF